MEKVKERLFYIDNLRLLMIIFVVIFHLAVTYSGIGSFYYIEGKHLDIFSTLWFAVALFFFSLIFGLVRLFIHKNTPVSNNTQIRPSLFNAVILILIISVCAFLIRLIQPIGTNILNMQLCFFASYIVLFIVGIKAYEIKLFSMISYKTGKRWLIFGIVFGLFVWLVLIAPILKNGNRAVLGGGFTWQSAVYSIWESLVGVAMSIGLIGVFREKFNHQSKLIKALSDSSFAVYMFHPPIIVAVCLLLKPITLLPIVKW